MTTMEELCKQHDAKVGPLRDKVLEAIKPLLPEIDDGTAVVILYGTIINNAMQVSSSGTVAIEEAKALAALFATPDQQSAPPGTTLS